MPTAPKDGPTNIDGLLKRMSTQDNAGADLEQAQQVNNDGGSMEENANSSGMQETIDGSRADDDNMLSAENVVLAATDKSTRNGYHLAQRRLLVFLFKQEKMRKRLLHPYVIEGLLSIPRDGAKYEEMLLRKAKTYCIAASPQFHPVNLAAFTELDFIRFLLSLSDTGNLVFRKGYGDIRSALTYLYSRCDVVQSPAFKMRLQKAMKGLKNTAAKARGELGATLGQGKHPLPFQAYRQICIWLLEEKSDESIFAHCFLTLTWNLICRSKNTVLVHRNHISWADDCLTILFAHSKTDPSGDLSFRERHIYANPLVPEICCITSLARYLACFPSGWAESLFPGSDQYERFRKILRRVVADHADDLARLGVNPENIGVHSIRKGAATYACNGTTGTVSFSAVCLRAGWTMGNVKDRYIHHEDAGDHVVGRVIAGLDVMSSNYLVSPPLFAISSANKCTEEMVDVAISAVFGHVSKEKWQLLRYLLASLCYHRTFHANVMHKKSRFRGSIAFRDSVLRDIVPCARISFPWEQLADVVPLWKLNYTGMTQLALIFLYFEEARVSRHAETATLTSAIQRLEEKIDDIEAVSGVGVSMDRVSEAVLAPVLARLSSIQDAVNALPVVSSSDSQEKSKPMMNLASLPENYVLQPNIGCLEAWVNWWHGEERTTEKGTKYRTPPWKTLTLVAMKKTGSTKTSLANLRFLCTRLDNAAGLLSVKRTPSISELYRMFTTPQIKNVLPREETPSGRKRRLQQMNWEVAA